MKTGKLFWGFFLLTLGGLFLLRKYDIFTGSFEFVWDIWPLIFVFWGALVIFKESLARPVISSVFGVFIALLLFGIVDNGIGNINCTESSGSYTEFYSEDYDSSIKTADLEIKAGGGLFILRESTDKLAEGKAKGSFADYKFETWQDDNHASVGFYMRNKNINFFRGR
ncbi:MAG: hypothetical protein CVV24_09340, partial [Ignavibacteriae bacterium HGW-Ignavibacteriae-3]